MVSTWVLSEHANGALQHMATLAALAAALALLQPVLMARLQKQIVHKQ
jgi:hypothetical protein